MQKMDVRKRRVVWVELDSNREPMNLSIIEFSILCLFDWLVDWLIRFELIEFDLIELVFTDYVKVEKWIH